MTDSTGQKQPPSQTGYLHPIAQTDIILHSLLAGLTPLIPLPFVDDWVKTRIMRQMVKKVAAVHHAMLSDADISILTSEPSALTAKQIAKKVVLYPIKKVFKKVVVVLSVKDTVDVTSCAFHTGYLLDYALQKNLHLRTTPERIRLAIDKVCREVGTSPVNNVLLAVFSQSKSLLSAAAQSLTRQIKVKEAPMSPIPEPEDPTESISSQAQPQEVWDLVHKVQSAINLMPPEHFTKLHDRFMAEVAS